MTTNPPACGHDSHACTEYNRLSRRQFLRVSSAATLAAAAAPAWLPRVSFAKSFVSGRDVIVSIYLRGGCDGLTMCVPWGESLYYTRRPTLAVARPGQTNGCVNLDGFFGLPPSMASLVTAFNDRNLAIVHAAGSTDPTRSHFDAQRFMEIGQPGNQQLFTGWLGRHVATASPTDPTAATRAIGIGTVLPMSLAGGPKTTPVPDLANYRVRGPSSTATARKNVLVGMWSRAQAELKAASDNTNATLNALGAINFSGYTPANGAVYPTNSSFAYALRTTAALIKADIGVEAVAVDRGGWDTHAAQGPVTGTMATIMADLANSLDAFYKDVITVRGNVTVVVMSEFGRRVAENASGGTDHGHGNVMFAMGQSIDGGRVHGIWPGLGNLFQNLDLQITTDYRDVLAEIVFKRLANPDLASVFPSYTPTFRGICR
jgi:uncharacterized protein (DUF1501 family)